MSNNETKSLASFAWTITKLRRSDCRQPEKYGQVI